LPVRGTTRLAAMPGTNTLRALLALLAAAAALSGCGSDEISGDIPAENAAALKEALGSVSEEVESGDCDAAASQVDQFIAAVNLLPADAGEELKTELRNAGINLRTLVDNQCTVTEPPPTTQETTTDTTPDTTSSTTDTTTTDTTDTTTTEEQPPPGNGNGNGPPGGVPPGNGPPDGGTDGGTGGTGGGGTGGDTGD
jgi:hypothetical protein